MSEIRPFAVSISDEAITDRGHQVVWFHLVAVEDGQGFARQVDHDRRFEHGGDLAEYFFTSVKRRAVARAVVL